METRIWLNKGWVNIKPDDLVRTTKAIHSFACFNSLRDSIFRSQGGYYKIEKNGMLTFVCRTLQDITFTQLYELLKD